MCLDIYSRSETDLNKKFKNNKVTFYKVLVYDEGGLITPFQKTIVKPGFFEALNPLNKNSLPYCSVTSGAIHVYTNKKMALDNACSYEIVIPVICHKKDFLAMGTLGDACFTKVFIRKKDYEKALKAKSKYAVVGK